MNICVFCSQYDVAEKYKKVARELATLIGQHKHTLVFGGCNKGLMGAVAETAKKGGSRVIGVIRERIKDKAYKEADEMIVVKDAKEMNLGLIERADALVILVGGIGTLNELTEVLRMVKNGLLQKPIVVVNTDNFYENFKLQLQKMHEENFLTGEVMNSVHFSETPEEALAYLESASGR